MSGPFGDAPDAPRVVTLGFDEETFGRLDPLRRRFFPADRNFIPAHLCLFHALPAEQDRVIAEAISDEARRCPILRLEFASILTMGFGFGLRVHAPALSALHRRLATTFAPWLTPQDRQPFRPHVTLMNKASRIEANLARSVFRDEFEPWGGVGDSIEIWAYLGGPWEPLARYPLEGGLRSPPED